MLFVFSGELSDYRNPSYINLLKSFIESSNIKNHIRILGFLDRTEQIVIMKNSKIVIQPSLFEGWGTVLEDAKVLDKTVLLSDIPVHREQMNNKCYLFNPNNSDELCFLLENKNPNIENESIENGILNTEHRAEEYSLSFEQLLKDFLL